MQKLNGRMGEWAAILLSSTHLLNFAETPEDKEALTSDF